MSSSRTNSTSSGMFSPKPMSWSLPRDSFSPHRPSMSSEGSVSRPDFWTASFNRNSSMTGCLLSHTPNRYRIAAIATGKEPCHPSDRSDTDTGDPVNLPIGHPALQELNYAPPVRHRLDLGRGTQIAQKGPAFVRG